MSHFDWAQLLIFVALVIALIPPLGRYLAAVFTGEPTALSVLQPLERLCYRLAAVDPHREMSWQGYAKALLYFNGAGFLLLLGILHYQNLLPLNPQAFPAVEWPLAFNIAMSFVTNTDWQSYAGETTLSNFSQMVGLTVQQFCSAATGFAVMVALTRGIARTHSDTIGNFWQDLVRSIVYILLPLSFLLAIIFVSQGAPQTLAPNAVVTTLEGHSQQIPLGPVATLVSIKELGSNGGGFFNVNSAHPFENPTALSNLLQLLSIVLLPAALIYAYGVIIKHRQHAIILLSSLFAIWLFFIFAGLYFEYQANPLFDTNRHYEGKEVRFGITSSVLWAISTTATSNGSANLNFSSLSPMTGGIALLNMVIGEVIFGGVGVGLCTLVLFTMLTLFLSGLMVGRTPEYQGKKIEKREMQWIVASFLLPSALILIGAGVSAMLPSALASRSHEGPHGLTEILYAFASAAQNNGSSFAGLNANTNYFNLILGVIFMLGRIAVILPSLAIAGLMAKKNYTAPTIGTLSTDTLLFGLLLACIIMIMGALTFLPALALGPILEHFIVQGGA